jgi:rhodanese-related sulfurtransferase
MSKIDANTGTYQDVRDIFPLEAREIITESRGKEDVVVLDVCTPSEFRTAHIEGAINIDYFSKLFKSRLDLLDRDKTYLVYCRMGGRSKFAQKNMKALGFSKVYNIVGGTLLWEEEGLPFATGRGPSKWIPCPISLTTIAYRKTRKALRAAYGAAAGALRSITQERGEADASN